MIIRNYPTAPWRYDECQKAIPISYIGFVLLVQSLCINGTKPLYQWYSGTVRKLYSVLPPPLPAPTFIIPSKVEEPPSAASL